VLLISQVVVPALLLPVHGLVGRSGEVISAALALELLAVHLLVGLGGCIPQQLLDR